MPVSYARPLGLPVFDTYINDEFTLNKCDDVQACVVLSYAMLKMTPFRFAPNNKTLPELTHGNTGAAVVVVMVVVMVVVEVVVVAVVVVVVVAVVVVDVVVVEVVVVGRGNPGHSTEARSLNTSVLNKLAETVPSGDNAVNTPFEFEL